MTDQQATTKNFPGYTTLKVLPQGDGRTFYILTRRDEPTGRWIAALQVEPADQTPGSLLEIAMETFGSPQEAEGGARAVLQTYMGLSRA